MKPQLISIIIPTLNEGDQLGESMTALQCTIDRHCEIIISDGGSSDQTLSLAKSFNCRTLQAPRGRAKQMNFGASQAKGNFLIFLHADNRLPADWLHSVRNCHNWGFFPVRLSGEHRLLRIIERAMCWRSKITSVATGDQALFFSKAFFSELQGFDDIPIMEDVAICKHARRFAQPEIAASATITSSRRWEQQGIWKTIYLMWRLRLAYWLGTNPQTLHRQYYPEHHH